MSTSFGQALRELRRSKDVTQRDLAAQVGVDFSYISKVENDRLPPPSADTVMKICEVLSIPADGLLSMTGKVPTSVRKMLGESSAAQQFMQQAHSLDLTEKEWKELTQNLKRLRSLRFFMQWSYSRRSLLEQCPRAYYYQYYGANKRTAKAEPLKDHLHFLKSLTNRHLRSGDIVHLVIRTYLNSLQRKDIWDVSRVLDWARQIFQNDYSYSSAYKPGAERSNDRYPPALLLEFYHDLEDADRLFFDSESRMIAALENFVSEPSICQFSQRSLSSRCSD